MLTKNINVVKGIQVRWISIKVCCKLWPYSQNIDTLYKEHYRMILPNLTLQLLEPQSSTLSPPLPSLITLWNNSNITWLGGESSIITTLKGLSVHFILFKIPLPNKKKTKHTKSVLNHNLKLGQCLKSTVFYMTITTMAEGCNNKFKNGIYTFNQMIIRETLVNVFPWEKSRHCTKKSLKMSAQYVTSVWIFSILFSIHFPQCC